MGIFKHASMNVFLKSMLRMKYKIIKFSVLSPKLFC